MLWSKPLLFYLIGSARLSMPQNQQMRTTAGGTVLNYEEFVNIGVNTRSARLKRSLIEGASNWRANKRSRAIKPSVVKPTTTTVKPPPTTTVKPTTTTTVKPSAVKPSALKRSVIKHSTVKPPPPTTTTTVKPSVPTKPTIPTKPTELTVSTEPTLEKPVVGNVSQKSEQSTSSKSGDSPLTKEPQSTEDPPFTRNNLSTLAPSIDPDVQQFVNQLLEDTRKLNSSERLMYSNMQWLMYLSSVVKDKRDSENYARRVAVATKLRHNAEIFPLTYITPIDGAMKIMGDINDKLLRSTLNPIVRMGYLQNCTMHFGSYVSNPQKLDTDFPKTVKRLKAINPKLEYDKNDLTPLQHAIVELYESPDDNAAKQIWLKDKESIWKLRSKAQLSHCDLDEITSLGLLSPITVREQLKSSAFEKAIKTFEEEEYALDAYLLGKIFRQRSMPKWYKQCLWVFYESSDSEVKTLIKKLEEEWPKMDRERRYDMYCEKFNALYNILSELDKHGPGQQLPANCEPTPEDYQDYIKKLNKHYDKDFVFVAETLCSDKLKQVKPKKG